MHREHRGTFCPAVFPSHSDVPVQGAADARCRRGARRRLRFLGRDRRIRVPGSAGTVPTALSWFAVDRPGHWSLCL
jgi:hypothetical protein